MMDYYGLFEKSVWVPTPLSNFFHKDYPLRQGSNYYNITSWPYKLTLLTGVYVHSLILSMVLFLLLLIHLAKWNFIKADKIYSSVKVHIKLLILICLGLVCVAIGSELLLHDRLVKSMEPEPIPETDEPGHVEYPDPREEDLDVEISEPVKNFYEACDRLMEATNETTVGYFKQYKLDVRGAYLANYSKEKFKRELQKFKSVQRVNVSMRTVVSTTNAFEKWKSLAWTRFLLFIVMWFIFASLVAAALYATKYQTESWVMVICALLSLCIASVMVTAECFCVADACQDPELIERTIRPETEVEPSPVVDENCLEYFKNKLKAAEELDQKCAVIVQVGEGIPQRIDNNETCDSINVSQDSVYRDVCDSMKGSLVVALKTRRVVINNDLINMQFHIALDENSTKISVEGDNVDGAKSSAVSHKLTVSGRGHEVFLIKFDEDYVKIKKLLDGRVLRSEIVYKNHATSEMKDVTNEWSFEFDDRDDTNTQVIILCCRDEINLPPRLPQSSPSISMNRYLSSLSTFTRDARRTLDVLSRRVRRWHHEHVDTCPKVITRVIRYNYTELGLRMCLNDYLLTPLVMQVIALVWTAVLLIVIMLLYIWTRKCSRGELKIRMFGTPHVSATGVSFTIKESTFGTSLVSQRRVQNSKSKKSNAIKINSLPDPKAKKSNVTDDLTKPADGRSSILKSSASDSDIHRRRRTARTGSRSARDVRDRRSHGKETADESDEGSTSTVAKGWRGRSTERQLVKFDYDSESFDIWDKAGVAAIKNITVVDPETNRPFASTTHGCVRDRLRGIFENSDWK